MLGPDIISIPHQVICVRYVQFQNQIAVSAIVLAIQGLVAFVRNVQLVTILGEATHLHLELHCLFAETLTLTGSAWVANKRAVALTSVALPPYLKHSVIPNTLAFAGVADGRASGRIVGVPGLVDLDLLVFSRSITVIAYCFFLIRYSFGQNGLLIVGFLVRQSAE